MAVLAATVLTAVGFTVGTTSASAAPTTSCSFASSGTGTFADALCWFDLSSYNAGQAASGQPFSVAIPGGYTLNFTMTVTGGPVAAVKFPTWSGAYLGNGGHYSGAAGKPALYQTSQGTTTVAKLTGISLVDANGASVGGYSLVGADAESTDARESITWTSSAPITSLTASGSSTGLGNACGGGFTGVGTTTVTCTGVASPSKTGTAILASHAPTSFSQTMVGYGLQGVAFGVLVSSVRIDKTVVNGYPGDSFTVGVTDSDGTTRGTASTGGGPSASVRVPVVVDAAGSSFQLAETATSGSLSNYSATWSCTRDGQPDPTLPTGNAGSSATVTVGIGDSVVCALTNTAKPASISLQKIAGIPVDVNHNGITDAGDTIQYSFLVTNTGQIPASGIAVSDSKAGTVNCPATTVAPQASVTCTAAAPYVITTADAQSGSVDNTATATATPVGTTASISSSPSSTHTPATVANPALSIVKSSSLAVGDDYSADQHVTYTYVVTNTGNVTLTGVNVTDGPFTGNGPTPVPVCSLGADTLAPGAQAICTADYVLTQADIDADRIDNSAVATGTPPSGGPVTSPPSSVSTPFTPAPAVSVVKTATPDVAQHAGDQVTYTFAVTNSGNVTLHGATITETAFSGTGSAPEASCPATSFAPGQTITCTATYSITQADADAGSVTNSATATATPPTGAPVTSGGSTATVTIPPAPSVSLVKTATPDSGVHVGDSVAYTFDVKNTGNVTLSGASIDETAFSGTGTAPTVTCPATSIAPGDTARCTASYTVTQADVDAGTVTNTATASAHDGDSTVTSAPSTATVTADRTAELTLAKSVTPTAVGAAGTTVIYSFLITNSGTTTLTNPTVSETSFSGSGALSGISCPATVRAPAASTTCTATYTVTQHDIDAGGVTNTATASATPPYGMDAPTSNTSTAHVTVTAAPALTIAKSVESTDSTLTRGGTLEYSFVITNTGNVTLSNVSVDETAFTGSGTIPTATCPDSAAELEPGAQVVCHASYIVTQADVDQGSVDNTAIATGTPPTEEPVTSGPGSATFPIVSAPGLSLTKTATPDTVHAAGDAVVYTFAATNTGNVTLTDVQVGEVSFSGTGGLGDVACPGGAIAPQQTVTCQATYHVTQADVDAGTVTNSANATALDPTDTPVTSPDAAATVSIPSAPHLTLHKTATAASPAVAGAAVEYHFAVTNDGNVTVHGLAIDDGTFTGTGAMGPITCSDQTVLPGQTVNCTADYTLTQPDVDAGQVSNTATATGLTPSDAPVTSDPDNAIVHADVRPSLSIVKSASPIDEDHFTAGQKITYTFVITNDGTVTLTGVTAVETAFTGNGDAPVPSCPDAAASLAPGDQVICTAEYTLTQADLDQGSVANTAVANGQPPGDTAPISSDPSSVTIPQAPAPALTIVKTADTARVTTVGQRITYTFTMTNTGNVSLVKPQVVERTFSGTGALGTIVCPAVSSLVPGQVLTCTAPYTVTSADLTGGAISNTAAATASTLRGTDVTADPSTVAVATVVPPAPPLAMTGGSIAWGTAAGGALLVAAGVVLLYWRRRRA
jgi:uncharacterized repeat protein (TIGR01451 family)